jgi:hypothetical protein
MAVRDADLGIAAIAIFCVVLYFWCSFWGLVAGFALAVIAIKVVEWYWKAQEKPQKQKGRKK